MTPALNHRKVCPMVANPQPDCFCVSLTSLGIFQVVDFCCDRFIECAIFLRQRGPAHQGNNPGPGPLPGEGQGVKS